MLRASAVFHSCLVVALGSVGLLAQQTSQSPVPQHCMGCELPALGFPGECGSGQDRGGDEGGGDLVLATMLKGGVIPRDALISGEVIESVAKKDGKPSRLRIRGWTRRSGRMGWRNLKVT